MDIIIRPFQNGHRLAQLVEYWFSSPGSIPVTKLRELLIQNLRVSVVFQQLILCPSPRPAVPTLLSGMNQEHIILNLLVCPPVLQSVDINLVCNFYLYTMNYSYITYYTIYTAI